MATGGEKTRVVLCDDAVGFPQLVALWLRTEMTELVATVDCASALFALLPEARADVVLLDLMLPEGPTSPGDVARVRELAPNVRVVLVSSTPGFKLAEEAERIGADAICHRATTKDQLRDVVLGRIDEA